VTHPKSSTQLVLTLPVYSIAIGRVTRLLEREDIPTAETVNANADARAADAAAAAQEVNDTL